MRVEYGVSARKIEAAELAQKCELIPLRGKTKPVWAVEYSPAFVGDE